jgi:phosphatidylserine/phosphatidylglycerophosphate/cardiolipin synthase-like enzyme
MDLYNKVKNLSLIIQPGDSFFPIVAAIDSAVHSINMTIFRMDDPIVRGAMSYAVSRGVEVRALVAPQSKGWTKRNRKLSEQLSELGVEVRFPKNSDQTTIRRYHYKMMTIDEAQSLILTFNPTQKNLHYARDFGVSIRDHDITSELNRLFDADWQGVEYQPEELPLVISPYNSRVKLMALLQSAQRSVKIMDAKLRDEEILLILLQKASSGCDVKVISREMHYDRIVPNLHVRQLARYKLHAKCIVVDSSRFFIGSQNLRSVSFEGRREVGIVIEDEPMSLRIERVFEEDWVNSTEILAEINRA